MVEQRRVRVAGAVALLGQAHDTLEARFNEQLVTSEFADLTAALSRNVLRWVSATDCRASQLALASGVSKQALSLQMVSRRWRTISAACGNCDRTQGGMTEAPPATEIQASA